MCARAVHICIWGFPFLYLHLWRHGSINSSSSLSPNDDYRGQKCWSMCINALFFFLKLRANIYAQDCANYTYFVETQLSIVFLAQKCFNLNPDDTSLHEADELLPQSLYFPWRGSSIVNTNWSQWNCLIYFNFRRKLKLNNYGTTIVLILYNERKKKCIHQCLIFYCKNKKKKIMQICL